VFIGPHCSLYIVMSTSSTISSWSKRDLEIEDLEKELSNSETKSRSIRRILIIKKKELEEKKKENDTKKRLSEYGNIIHNDTCIICMTLFSEGAGSPGFSILTYSCGCSKSRTIHTSCWFRSEKSSKNRKTVHNCCLCSKPAEFSFGDISKRDDDETLSDSSDSDDYSESEDIGVYYDDESEDQPVIGVRRYIQEQGNPEEGGAVVGGVMNLLN